jgi:hypothetical protein
MVLVLMFYSIIAVRAHTLGYDTTCRICHGEGSIWPSAVEKEMADEWQSFPPPKGPGYQLWETVTEGSPVSPVFDTPEGLAEWIVANQPGTTLAGALKFVVSDGWCPSAVQHPGEALKTGLEDACQ